MVEDKVVKVAKEDREGSMVKDKVAGEEDK